MVARLHTAAALLAALLIGLLPLHAHAQLTYSGTLARSGHLLELHFHGPFVETAGTVVITSDEGRCERLFAGELGGNPPSVIAVVDCPAPTGTTRIQYGPVEGDDPDVLQCHVQDATGRYRATLRRQ